MPAPDPAPDESEVDVMFVFRLDVSERSPLDAAMVLVPVSRLVAVA